MYILPKGKKIRFDGDMVGQLGNPKPKKEHDGVIDYKTHYRGRSEALDSYSSPTLGICL